MGFPVFVNGRGKVDSDELAVDRAVNQYDERLRFGPHDEAGEYCVFLKMPPDFEGVNFDGNGPYMPLMGFGPVLPNPEATMKRLLAADALRNGYEILDRMNKENARSLKLARDAGSEQSGQLAEVLEWAMRKKGTHPSPRVFVPADIKD